MTTKRRKPFTAAPATSWKPVLEARAAREAETQRGSGPKETAALETLVALFDFATTARVIDEGIASGKFDKSTPKPPRCTRTIAGHGLCNLPLRSGETGRCAFHKAVHDFQTLGLDENDIYEGTPAEAVIRSRFSALKPKG